MKHHHKRRNLTIYNRPMYPNAADRNYIMGRLLNVVTALVSGMGFFTAMVCLVLLA